MSAIQTRPWDPAEHLTTKEEIAAYLEAALEEGDPKLVAMALRDIARSQGMAQLAREAGLECDDLQQALAIADNPEFAAVLKLVRVLGLGLKASAA